MYSLKVVPSKPNKLLQAEHLKYITVRKLLKEYNLNKDAASDFRNVHYAAEEMRSFIKSYRKGLKECSIDYVFNYETKNRVWAKLVGKIEWKFSKSVFNSKSIQLNRRHEIRHKHLFMDATKSKIEWFKEMKQHIQERYQQARQRARVLRTTRRERMISKIGNRIRYEVCAGIIHRKNIIALKRGESPRGRMLNEMGVIMRFLKSADKQVVFEEKKPQTKDNYIGVELEFFCDLDKDDLSFKLYEAGLGKHVCLKDDGSIHGEQGAHNHEVCILAKEKDIFSVIKDVSEVLRLSNAKVNKSCGLHVHLDMRNRDHEVAFHNLISSQNVLYAMNPFSRQAGTYCKRVETKDFKIAASGDRYFGINATAFAKHKTIEIRIHSGTIMDEKINNWIKLLLAITSKKGAVKQSSSSLKGFLKEYDVDGKLGKYIFERVAKFAGEDKKNAEEKGAA